MTDNPAQLSLPVSGAADWTDPQVASGSRALDRAGEPISGVGGGDNRWAYFHDPEGNLFESTERQARPSTPG